MYYKNKSTIINIFFLNFILEPRKSYSGLDLDANKEISYHIHHINMTISYYMVYIHLYNMCYTIIMYVGTLCGVPTQKYTILVQIDGSRHRPIYNTVNPHEMPFILYICIISI